MPSAASCTVGLAPCGAQTAQPAGWAGGDQALGPPGGRRGRLGSEPRVQTRAEKSACRQLRPGLPPSPNATRLLGTKLAKTSPKCHFNSP